VRRWTKWLVAAALGLSILVAAGMAASFTLGRDPASLVLFDVRLTKTANRYLRDNGTTYTFWRHGVGLRDNIYYIDQFQSTMLGPAEYAERVFRYRILRDWKGAPYFSSNHEFGFKDDDHQLDSLHLTSRRIRNYRDRKKEGKPLPLPRDFDAYKTDGLTMRVSSDGGCDPLKTYDTISSAEIDSNMTRLNEKKHIRSLVLLGEFTMLSSISEFARKNCRHYTNWLGQHSTKANAYAFSVYRLEKDYALITHGFPLTFIVTNPREEFCHAISYRDAYGTRRIFYAIYTSPDTLAEMLGEEKFTSRKSREVAPAEAEYRRKAETRYETLMRAVDELDCTEIRK
jgi:hypothetical protein